MDPFPPADCAWHNPLGEAIYLGEQKCNAPPLIGPQERSWFQIPERTDATFSMKNVVADRACSEIIRSFGPETPAISEGVHVQEENYSEPGSKIEAATIRTPPKKNGTQERGVRAVETKKFIEG